MLPFEHIFHGFAVDIFHCEIENAFIFADGIGLNDIGMIQLGCGACLFDEPDDEFGVVRVVFRKDFKSGGTVQGDLVRQINDSHSAASEFPQNDEITDYGSCCDSRGRDGDTFSAMTALYIRPHICIVNRYNSSAKWTLKPHSNSAFYKISIPIHGNI